MRANKSITIYNDQQTLFNALSDTLAGKLIKAMLEYSNTEKTPELPEKLKYVFIPLQQQLERAGKTYESTCQKNKENIEKRWKNSTKYHRIRPNTTVYDGIPLDTKHTDTDKDTDNITSVFQHWNKQKIIAHAGLTKTMARTIALRLKEYTPEQLTLAITNYGRILADPGTYYFKYRWTLVEFLTRGLDKFLDFKIAHSNFKRDSKTSESKGANARKLAYLEGER